MFIIQLNLDNDIIITHGLIISNYFVKKDSALCAESGHSSDSIKKIDISKDKLIQGIIKQNNLITSLDINDNINKAVSLANYIYSVLPNNNLVKIFINQHLNYFVDVVVKINNKNLIIPDILVKFKNEKPNIKIYNYAGVYVIIEIKINKQSNIIIYYYYI